jgi:hypothetical protein
MKTNVFLKARKIVPKIKYDKVDVNKDRIFSYEKVMTGFLEDLKMNAILGIDKIMNALRRWSKDFFYVLEELDIDGDTVGGIRPATVLVTRSMGLLRICRCEQACHKLLAAKHLEGSAAQNRIEGSIGQTSYARDCAESWISLRAVHCHH